MEERQKKLSSEYHDRYRCSKSSKAVSIPGGDRSGCGGSKHPSELVLVDKLGQTIVMDFN